jgi:hypothetical protein
MTNTELLNKIIIKNKKLKVEMLPPPHKRNTFLFKNMIKADFSQIIHNCG